MSRHPPPPPPAGLAVTPPSPRLYCCRPAAISPDCPRAALYIIPTLPNIKTVAQFEAVRATYVATVLKLMPPGETLPPAAPPPSCCPPLKGPIRAPDAQHMRGGYLGWASQGPCCPRSALATACTPPHPLPRAGSTVIPVATEPEDGALAVHTVLLFSSLNCAQGKEAAKNLHVRLLGDVRPLFYAPAGGLAPATGSHRPPYGPKSLFGDVHMETISHPYLVRCAPLRPAPPPPPLRPAAGRLAPPAHRPCAAGLSCWLPSPARPPAPPPCTHSQLLTHPLLSPLSCPAGRRPGRGAVLPQRTRWHQPGCPVLHHLVGHPALHDRRAPGQRLQGRHHAQAAPGWVRRTGATADAAAARSAYRR